jgi:hypothetical protein
MDAQILISLVGDLGALGFVFWMAWRLTNHTIPRLAAQFEAATDRQRADFKEMLSTQRDAFSNMMERERQVHGEHIARVIEAIKDLRE